MGGPQLWEEINENRMLLHTIRRATGLSLSVQRSIAQSLVTGSIVDLPLIQFYLEDTGDIFKSYCRLCPPRLMIFFIALASSNRIFIFSFCLRACILAIMGYHMAFESGILTILDVMCIYAQYASEEKQVMMHPKFRHLLLVAFIRLAKRGSGTNVMSSIDLESAALKLLMAC